jgi:glutathione S-transferase
MEKHMERREYLVGGAVTVADLVAAYTLDMATVGWPGEAKVLDGLPSLRRYMERMYQRPRAPQRIADAFASVRG